jgi:DNA-binding beta-propeller fold protein YncE
VKTLKQIAASGMLASLVWLTSLTLAGPALANGVGDLYVASSSGVLELHVATSTVVSTIPVSPSPQTLAFSPDGRTLYASTGNAQVTPIDIATLDVQTPIDMPGPVSGLAFPAGQILVGAMPTRRTLAFATVHGGPVTESAQLPGSGNLLAGDRRDARVAVAEAGKSWLAIVDPATSALKKTTVDGEIRALAIERDRGGVLVAAHNPDSLIRIDLTSLAVSWTVKLTGTPAGVAALASNAVVAGDSNLWLVNGKTASAFATTRQTALALTTSDEGSFLHVAEASAVEVFDTGGKLQRTLELPGERAPVAMAAVPRGSSLFLGQGQAAPSATTPGQMPGALATVKPPTTSTVVDVASGIAASPPFQGALIVALLILVVCRALIAWHDRRAVRPS